LRAKIAGKTPEQLNRENEAVAGLYMQGAPVAGRFVPQTEDMTRYEVEHPTRAAIAKGIGGAVATAPLVEASPFLFGAAGSLPARLGMGAASAGVISGADTATGDVLQGKGGVDTALDTARAAAIGAPLGAAGVGVGSLASIPVNAISRALMRGSNPLVDYLPNAATSVKEAMLTPEGENTARALGLDPAKMSPWQREQFAFAQNPAEAADAFKNENEFGIRSTLGQRTKDPQQLHAEEQMRRGLMGPQAKDIMSTFDKEQGEAVRTAARQQIPGEIAPAMDTADMQTLGGEVQSSMRSAHQTAKNKVSSAWDQIGPIYASPEAKGELPQYIQGSVDNAGVAIDPQLTPAAHKMLTTLEDYSNNVASRSPYKILGEKFGTSGGAAPDSLTPEARSVFANFDLPPEPSPTADLRPAHVDEMRRKLLALSNSGSTPADSLAARHIYNGFNEWANDLPTMANPLTQGDPGDLAKIASAREITKDVKSLFEPTKMGSKSLTPAGKILANAYGPGSTPESVITSFVGTGPKQTVNDAQVQALKQAKQIFGADPKYKDAWDSLRLAYWTKLTSNTTGKLTTPGYISNRIETAFNNQKSVLDALYSPAELAKMRNYQAALDTITFKPPNASGSSYGMQQKPEDSITKTLLDEAKGMGVRSLAMGNHPVGAAMDFGLNILPKMMQSKETKLAESAAEAARRAVNQSVAQRQPYPYAQHAAPIVTTPAAPLIIRSLLGNNH
jgi:hypothetical protein